MSRSKTRIDAARAMRDRLREAGNHRDALTIDDVLRTLRSTQATLKVIHRDNMELRRQLGLPAFGSEQE
jgi:hypothetical protein